MKKRIDITLSESHLKKINEMSRKKDLSVSELIRRAIDEFCRSKEFNNGRPFHGSYDVEDGKLTGMTDTDYFYFICPKCGDTQILQVLDFGIVKDGPVERYEKERRRAKRDFILAFELYCPECKLHDFVKVSNVGWAGGKLKDSWALTNQINKKGGETRKIQAVKVKAEREEQ